MQLVDEETRAIVRNARLDALEADNFGVDAEENADDASDDVYVDDDDASKSAPAASSTGTPKDKRARKQRKAVPKTYVARIVCAGSDLRL